jgi:hypothetical protein
LKVDPLRTNAKWYLVANNGPKLKGIPQYGKTFAGVGI